MTDSDDSDPSRDESGPLASSDDESDPFHFWTLPERSFRGLTFLMSKIIKLFISDLEIINFITS